MPCFGSRRKSKYYSEFLSGNYQLGILLKESEYGGGAFAYLNVLRCLILKFFSVSSVLSVVNLLHLFFRTAVRAERLQRALRAVGATGPAYCAAVIDELKADVVPVSFRNLCAKILFDFCRIPVESETEAA